MHSGSTQEGLNNVFYQGGIPESELSENSEYTNPEMRGTHQKER